MFTVIKRVKTESLQKGNITKTTFSVTLKGPDGHVHKINSENPSVYEEYSIGTQRELAIEKTKQTKLAVSQLREDEKTEQNEETEESEAE
jgi:hypothetical protein